VLCDFLNRWYPEALLMTFSIIDIKPGMVDIL